MRHVLIAILPLFLVVACGTSAPPPRDVTQKNSSCTGQTIHAGKTDYCLVKNKRSFGDAQKSCEAMGARLAVLDDAAKAKAVADALASPWGYGSGLWLGCSDEDKEGTWLCDGKPMGHAPWAPGQPDNELALDDCLEWLADTGKWNDATCAWKLGYVCRGDAALKCAGKRIEIGKTVFCARGDDLRDWDGARKACEGAGGKLAVPENDAESKALFDALKHPVEVPSTQPGLGVWIGLSDEAEEGKFKWVSGSPASFGNWLAGQPDDANHGEDCATLTLGDGKWNDADCGTPLPYLCEPK